jgi:hypothetical protein
MSHTPFGVCDVPKGHVRTNPFPQAIAAVRLSSRGWRRHPVFDVCEVRGSEP